MAAHFGEQMAQRDLIEREGDTSKAVTNSSQWSSEDKRKWLYSEIHKIQFNTHKKIAWLF